MGLSFCATLGHTGLPVKRYFFYLWRTSMTGMYRSISQPCFFVRSFVRNPPPTHTPLRDATELSNHSQRTSTIRSQKTLTVPYILIKKPNGSDHPTTKETRFSSEAWFHS